MSRSLAGGRTRATTLAKWPSAFSSRWASSSDAPFWGPKTALAPLSPSSGESTSLAMTRSTPRSRSRTASRPATSSRRRGGERQPAVPEAGGRPDPQGAEQAGTRVVGARPTEPDDDASGAGVEGREHERADPRGRCHRWVALVRGEQVQAGRLRRLHVSRPAARARRQQDGAGHLTAERVGGHDGVDLPREGLGEDVDEAGSAVGERHEREHGRPAPSAPSPRPSRPRPGTR